MGLLGSVLGLLTGGGSAILSQGISAVVDNLKGKERREFLRQEQQHELEIMQLEANLAAAQAQAAGASSAAAAASEAEARGDEAASQAYQAAMVHEVAVGKGASQWAVNLRSLVRPGISYWVTAILTVFGLWTFSLYGKHGPELDAQIIAAGVMAIEALGFAFQHIISFWFLDRSLSKARGRS